MFEALVFSIGVLLAQPVVVDGDTLHDGRTETYRVENIDAPERGHRAECAYERELAEAARTYVFDWVARAERVEAIPVGQRDRYGRVIARIEIDGIDLGQRLINEGLAQPWRGRKADFCTLETAAR